MNLIENAKRALAALETRCGPNAFERDPDGAITLLRESITEAEKQEPVAYLKFWAYQQVSQDGSVNADDGLEVCRPGEIGMDGKQAIPVYTHPQQPKEWVGLTDEQMAHAWAVADGEHNASASVKRRITAAIDAALKAKNGGQS